MRNLCPVGSTMALVLLGLGGALLVHPAGAATPCTNLPPSTLQVYVIKASTPEPVAVPAEELDRAAQAEHLVSRHTLMLTSSDFVAWSDVAHRMVSRADGSVCDAPTLVRIGFGSSRRFAFLARAAVADVCVRQEMLDHEAAHSRALVDVVDRFIRQQQSMLERGMATLKQTPAPSDGIAKEGWETGLRAIVAAAKEQLLTELRSSIAGVDEPSALDALEDACGGKIRELERRSGSL
jgi:hypothetical protein